MSFYAGCMIALILSLAVWASLALIVVFVFKWLVLAMVVLDERPEFDADTQTWIQKDRAEVSDPNEWGSGSGGPSLAEPGTTAPGSSALDAAAAARNTPSGATDLDVTHSRGEAQNADQLQAEIDRLTAEKNALSAKQGQGTSNVESNPPTGATPPGT